MFERNSAYWQTYELTCGRIIEEDKKLRVFGQALSFKQIVRTLKKSKLKLEEEKKKA